MQGLTFAAIGAEMGVTWQAAQQAVRRSLEITKADISERPQELRALKAERLEKITEVLWPQVLEGDLRAIDRVLRTRESYRRLTGLDLERETSQVSMGTFVLTSGTTPDQIAAIPAGAEIIDTRYPGAGGDGRGGARQPPAVHHQRQRRHEDGRRQSG